MIDSLSMTGLEYGTTFLAIQLFADFEVEYLSLPESYDNNFVIPCLTTLWSIINIKKKFLGSAFFWRQMPIENYNQNKFISTSSFL